ncbi:MAG: methyl-accepting chemotaxis protein [Lachnospiraceae bacterium]|nr:methyl-accepting chemotaxis protein [Lachnospiraceae bacterium]
MKTFFIVLEAIIILILLFFMIRDYVHKKVLMKQANLIKKRRMDLDDIDHEGTDSLAALAGALNVIKNNMLTFLESTKSNVVVLSDAIDVLSNGADLNREGSQRIAESLNNVVYKVEEQLELVKSCLDLIENNTGKMTEIDDSVTEIGRLLAETVESCKNGVSSMEKYENNMSTVSENLDRSEKILEEFTDKINEINEIGAFIVSISESLKMLALNASIEAARVGAAGSGFAVVAKEMGVMSAKTQQGIGTINEILDNVIESSDQVTQEIQNSVEMFSASRKEFDAVSASFRAIDQQSGVINDKMQLILTEIDDITKNSVVTKERAEQAYVTSEEITSGTQEISQVSEQTSEVSKTIIENVGNLNSMLDGL